MSDHCKHCRAALEAPTRRQLMTGAAALVAASALSVGRAKAATDPIVTPQNVIPPIRSARPADEKGMPATWPISRMRETSRPAARRARRRNIPSPRSSVAPTGHTNCGAIDAAIKVVKEGIELPDIAIFLDLQAGLEHALALRGFVVSRRRSG